MPPAAAQAEAGAAPAAEVTPSTSDKPFTWWGCCPQISTPRVCSSGTCLGPAFDGTHEPWARQ